IAGDVDERAGWLQDFADITAVVKPLIERELDHRTLNDVPGPENPPPDRLCPWMWNRLRPPLPTPSPIPVPGPCPAPSPLPRARGGLGGARRALPGARRLLAPAPHRRRAREPGLPRRVAGGRHRPALGPAAPSAREPRRAGACVRAPRARARGRSRHARPARGNAASRSLREGAPHGGGRGPRAAD